MAAGAVEGHLAQTQGGAPVTRSGALPVRMLTMPSAAARNCGSRKLDLRAFGYSTPVFPIQHNRLAWLLRAVVISRDPTSPEERLFGTQTGLRNAGARRRNGPLDESGSRGVVTVTPLDIPARFRQRDVRTDDAARQPAPLLPRAPTPAAAPNDSPASPSPATDEFACRDNTLGRNFKCRCNATALTMIRWSRHSRRIVPITRSMYARGCGTPGAPNTS